MGIKTARIVSAVILLGAATSTATAQEAWNITTMLPLTGPFTAVSPEMKSGMEIAVDEINAKGGIKGNKIKLTMLDTQSNPAQVATLIREACSDALIVAGPTLSNEARVAFPVAKSLECPAIASNAAAKGITTNSRPWAFAYATPAEILSPSSIELIVKKLKPKRAVVIVEKSDPSASDQGDVSAKSLKDNGVQVETFVANGNDVDFGPVVTRTAGASPDLVVIATIDKAAVGLIREMRKSQLKAAIMLTQSSLSGLVNALDAETIEGVYRYAEADPGSSSDPRVKQFVKAFQDRNSGKMPTFIAVATYDTISLISDMIQAADLSGKASDRSSDRKKFVEKLSGVKDWHGLAGTMSMSAEGFMVKPATVLVSHNGKLERVTAD